MVMVDPFTPSAFTLTALTAAINNLKYQPMRLSSLFEEAGIATLQVAIDIQDGVLSVIDVAPRGAPGKVVLGESRRALPFLIPHLPARASLLADAVQGVRAFGSESTAEVLQTKLTERLEQVRRNIDYTLETHRMQALLGNYIDANGATQSLFTTFGVTQQTQAMGWSTSASSTARAKAMELIIKIENALDGLPFTGIRCLCGSTVWTDLLEDKDAKETYLNTQMASDLRNDPRIQFNWNGITWERYRGTTACKIPDAEAYAFPEGVSGLFITRFAPANYVETVNTIGLPYYAKSEPMDFGKGYTIEAQSNPLNLCTRPAAVIKVTKT